MYRVLGMWEFGGEGFRDSRSNVSDFLDRSLFPSFWDS